MKKYIIKGEAVAKGRPRFTRRGHTYTPKKTRDYENKIKASLIAQDAKPAKNALKLHIDIYKGYLKSWTKKQLEQAKNGELLPVKRPDVDNYAKSILDGSNGILFEDDSQIVELNICKHYDNIPRVEILVEEL